MRDQFSPRSRSRIIRELADSGQLSFRKGPWAVDLTRDGDGVAWSVYRNATVALSSDVDVFHALERITQAMETSR